MGDSREALAKSSKDRKRNETDGKLIQHFMNNDRKKHLSASKAYSGRSSFFYGLDYESIRFYRAVEVGITRPTKASNEPSRCRSAI